MQEEKEMETVIIFSLNVLLVFFFKGAVLLYAVNVNNNVRHR